MGEKCMEGDKEAENCMQILMPNSIFRISVLAKKFVVPCGSIFLQMLNGGLAVVNSDGYVSYKYS
jgi:hypothetical protein